MFPIIIGRRPNSGLNDSGKFSTTSIGTGSDDHNSSNNTDTNRPPTVRIMTIWTAACENVSSGICKQSDQGLHCLLTELLDSTKRMNGEQRPG